MSWLTVGFAAASVLAYVELRKATSRARELEGKLQTANRKLLKAHVQQLSLVRVLRTTKAKDPDYNQLTGNRAAEGQLIESLSKFPTGLQLVEDMGFPWVSQPIIFVSDASKAGHAVYSFDLPDCPYIFLEPMSAADWQQLGNSSPWLEARAISLGLSNLLSNKRARRALEGAEVVWLTDNQMLALNLSHFSYSGQDWRDSGLKQEYRTIHTLIKQLKLTVRWRWRSRKRAAMDLAHQLSAISDRQTVTSKKVKDILLRCRPQALLDLRLA